MNLQELSDEELDGLRIAVLSEQERRVIVTTAADQIAALQDAYERATTQEVASVAVPDKWRQQVTEQLN